MAYCETGYKHYSKLPRILFKAAKLRPTQTKTAAIKLSKPIWMELTNSSPIYNSSPIFFRKAREAFLKMIDNSWMQVQLLDMFSILSSRLFRVHSRDAASYFHLDRDRIGCNGHCGAGLPPFGHSSPPPGQCQLKKWPLFAFQWQMSIWESLRIHFICSRSWLRGLSIWAQSSCKCFCPASIFHSSLFTSQYYLLLSMCCRVKKWPLTWVQRH